VTGLDELRRAAIVGVALAFIVSFPANAAFFAAFGWNIEAAIFGDAAAILDRDPSSGSLLRWGAIGDMFYSYLLLVPLALFLHRRLRPNGPWIADLGIAAAFAYTVAGAAGAAILAIPGSSLVDAYSVATPADQPAIATSFELVRNVVYFAIWQMLDPLTAGTWILTTGALLFRERPLLGRFLIVLGLAFGAMSLLTMIGVRSLALLALGVVGVVVIWAGWAVIGRSSAAS
jgi:hypothetical protein